VVETNRASQNLRSWKPSQKCWRCRNVRRHWRWQKIFYGSFHSAHTPTHTQLFHQLPVLYLDVLALISDIYRIADCHATNLTYMRQQLCSQVTQYTTWRNALARGTCQSRWSPTDTFDAVQDIHFLNFCNVFSKSLTEVYTAEIDKIELKQQPPLFLILTRSNVVLLSTNVSSSSCCIRCCKCCWLQLVNVYVHRAFN